MKKIFLIFIVFLLTASACAPTAQPTEQPLIPVDDALDLTPAERAAVARLSSTLNLPPGQISVIATEAVEWPDGCLGIQREGLMCTQAIVPGYKILLQANGAVYEFRTNESGTQVVMVEKENRSFDSPEEMVVAQLASNLGLNESEIEVVSSLETEFSDACMGVVMFDMTCAQAVTPGKVIVLAYDDIHFEYHVSEDGTQVQPATLALTWKREGGIAGFCNGLTVFLSGEVYGNDCRSEPNGTMMVFSNLISPKEQKQFFEWAGSLEKLSVDASDPAGVSDRMVVTLEFFGNGSGEMTEADQQALFEFAQGLYQKLYS